MVHDTALPRSSEGVREASVFVITPPSTLINTPASSLPQLRFPHASRSKGMAHRETMPSIGLRGLGVINYMYKYVLVFFAVLFF